MLVVFGCFVYECLTHIWRLQQCYSRGLVEVDFLVSYYNCQMKLFKSIKPFQLISAIVEKAKEKINRDNSKNKQNKTESQIQQPLQEQYSEEVTYAESQNFMLELQKISAERKAGQDLKRRKIALFQKVEVEPHYLQNSQNKKILQFEFQLGSDVFLERVKYLQQQIIQINTVISLVLLKNKDEAINYITELLNLENQINKLINLVQIKREQLKNMSRHAFYRSLLTIKKRNVIKQKIKLLKKTKQKNEMTFLEITNIDQAFVTQQRRSKFYQKIQKLTALEKSIYVTTVKKKLISTSFRVKEIVQSGIRDWLDERLPEKQIQKLVFLIYYIEEKIIYKENSIKIDFNIYNKPKLTEQIKKIFEWKNFTYVKNIVTRERINEFLGILLKKIE